MEEVLSEVRKGSLDENPRLCRRVICSKCAKTGKKLIDLLKEGHFEVGRSERISVIEPGQYALFKYEEETATTISIRSVCEKCGHEEVVSDPVLTLEYLTGICKCKKPRITYA
jgi:hypothetical protein